jgi:hypothetical protein
MGVPFNAVTFDKHYVTLRALAEIVPAIGGNRHDGAFEHWHRFQSHVARVNDRCRLRRRYIASSESDISLFSWIDHAPMKRLWPSRDCRHAERWAYSLSGLATSGVSALGMSLAICYSRSDSRLIILMA